MKEGAHGNYREDVEQVVGSRTQYKYIGRRLRDDPFDRVPH